MCGDLARLLPEEVIEEGAVAPAFNVLFVHNSARSIKAEAILERIGKGRFNGYSAGSEPAAKPMREVIDRLKIMSHDVSRLHSKSWNEFVQPDAPRIDFVIGLCDTPRGQRCPDFGGKAIVGAWPLPDPAKFTGSRTERTTFLNELYGMIRRRLELFIHLPFGTLDKLALKDRLNEIGEMRRVSV